MKATDLADHVERLGQKPLSDGLSSDREGGVRITDVEHGAVLRMTPPVAAVRAVVLSLAALGSQFGAAVADEGRPVAVGLSRRHREGALAVTGLAGAAQQHAVAALETQAGCIGSDVRARLEDDAHVLRWRRPIQAQTGRVTRSTAR